MLCTTINEGIKKLHPITLPGRLEPIRLVGQHTAHSSTHFEKRASKLGETQWCKPDFSCTHNSVQHIGTGKKSKCTLLWWPTVQIRRHWPLVNHMHTLSRRWQCKAHMAMLLWCLGFHPNPFILFTNNCIYNFLLGNVDICIIELYTWMLQLTIISPWKKKKKKLASHFLLKQHVITATRKLNK